MGDLDRLSRRADPDAVCCNHIANVPAWRADACTSHVRYDDFDCDWRRSVFVYAAFLERSRRPLVARDGP